MELPVLYGAYWTIEDGYEAQLTLSNTTDEALTVWPTLYDIMGTPLALDAVELGPHEYIVVDIGS